MKRIISIALIAITAMQCMAAVTLTGRVLDTAGKALAGVKVTDGRKFTVTDSKGKYKLTAADNAKHVYLTLPTGYKVPVKDGVPVIYADITPDAKGKFSHDFILEPSDRDMNRQVLFVMADPQVYFDPNLDEVKRAALEMKELATTEYADREALGICAGDIIGRFEQGETYFPWMIKNIAETGFPYFYVCGNHDIEMDVPNNELARKSFNKYFGPTYYSFDRGKVHYVVLDDVYWMGRYYAGYLPLEQLDWLREDLSTVPEGSLVIVSMHIPCYSREARHQKWDQESYHKVLSNRSELFKILEPYNAHLMTGHEHYNENYVFNDHLYEHCHAPLSTVFWFSNWAMDGTPEGYAVYVIDGDRINWYYKSLGYDKNYQIELYPRGRSREHPEAVVANVWNRDRTWKIEWYEDGVLRGDMTEFTGRDPNIYHEAKANGSKYAFSWVGPNQSEHLYYVVPQSETSVITVRVTDHNGNVYTQTLDQSKYLQ